eukprot:scaffold693_cov200-Alexandrium_tamarense.AAC.22
MVSWGTLRRRMIRTCCYGSYEALFGLRSAYLFEIYEVLGINSTFDPEFRREQEVYQTNYFKK